jgi:hypothetical protein
MDASRGERKSIVPAHLTLKLRDLTHSSQVVKLLEMLPVTAEMGVLQLYL